MIKYFATHKTAANLIMLFFLIIGAASLSSLQLETLPKRDLKYVQVKVTYPGAMVEDVEDGVCRKLEDAIDAVANLEEINCESKEGVGIAKLEIVEGMNWDDFVDDIKKEVDTIDNFPDEVDKVTVEELDKKEPVIDLVIYSQNEKVHLKEYANKIKDELQKIDGISLVNIEGVSTHEFRVSIPLINLQKYSLTMTEVSNQLKSQNINIPSGIVENQKQEFSIKFENEKREISKLGSIIIKNSQNSEIKLSQIATIEERFKLDEEKIIFNNKPALILKISKTRSEDTVKIANKIKEYVQNKTFPSSVKVELINDLSNLTIERLELLRKNAFQGLILVFLTLWLFFRIRFAFWVAMGLPVSFLGGFWLMGVFGVSINMLSMVALLIAIGILMDDAIVISENIASEYKKTNEVIHSIVVGVQKVKNGVISSFLTTTAIFLPLSFLSGNLGQVLKVVPIVLILVLIVSLIEAFFILPRHLSHSLDDINKTNSFRKKFDEKVEYIKEKVVQKYVQKAIKNRYLFLGFIVALFFFSISLLVGGVIKFQSFPDIEGDFVDARIIMPQGTPLKQTQEVVDKIINKAKNINQEYHKKYGVDLVKNYAIYYNKNLDSYEQGKHIATISLELLTSSKREIQMNDFITQWKSSAQDIPNALLIAFKEPVLMVAGLPIEIKLFSNDLKQLDLASKDLVKWLSSYNGIFYVNSDLRAGKDIYKINLKEGSLTLGITSSMVANELRSALYGFESNEFQKAKESIEVNVKLEDNSDLQTIKDLKIKGVPLSEIANIKKSKSYSRINRIDKQKAVTIQGEIDTRKANAKEILSHTQEEFFPILKQKYPHVDIKVYGQAKEAQKTGKSFVKGFAVGLFLIFLLLSLQFKSYLEPIIVMAIIPFTFIGVIWGHLIMGINLTFPSILGYVSLAGIVINGSILLVLFLKSHSNTLEFDKALVQASKDRFLPIMLTSITTMAGLIPLLLETSFQAQVLIPLVVSVVFGLFTATIMVLFVVPVLYKIIDDFKN